MYERVDPSDGPEETKDKIPLAQLHQHQGLWGHSFCITNIHNDRKCSCFAAPPDNEENGLFGFIKKYGDDLTSPFLGRLQFADGLFFRLS